MRTATTDVITPAASTGLLMAAYLLMRPYGDAAGGQTLEAAAAFGSAWWVASHLFGLLALVSFAWLALRVSDVVGGTTALTWQRSGLRTPAWAAWPIGVGIALVLPQFFVAPVGRMAFGIAYAVAAAVLVVAVMRPSTSEEAHERPAELEAEQAMM